MRDPRRDSLGAQPEPTVIPDPCLDRARPALVESFDALHDGRHAPEAESSGRETAAPMV